MKIFYVMGKSGSGKDTIKANLLKNTKIIMYPLIEATDRPRREGETNEHMFLSKEEMDKLVSSNDVIEHRTYNVNHPDKTWTYATLPVAESNSLIYVGIGTLESYKSILQYYGEDIVKPIYIEVGDTDRLIRSLYRDGKDNTKAHLETCRRFIADADDYSEEKISEVGITRHARFKNTDSLSSTISRITAYIMKNTTEERGV